ncbi:Putative ribonuclease H protein At1g65750 [Linum perenne]
MEVAMDRDNRLHPNQGMRMEAHISWKPGPCDWVTVNVDGSVLRSPARADYKGVVRSEDGRAIGAFAANLGCCSVTRAELRGAVLGLELAWSMGCRNVELQLDSRAAIALIQQVAEPSHQHALEVLADFVTNRGHDFPFGVHLFPLSDCNLPYMLRHDYLGVSALRNILVIN